MNIFEAIDTGDVRKIINVVDPVFKKAAAAASARAHAKGIEVADGRPSPRCPEIGQRMFRSVRPMTITYHGRQAAFDMPGWYCDRCNHSIHTGEDSDVFDRALDQLKAELAADDTSPRNKTKFAASAAADQSQGLIKNAFDGGSERSRVLPIARSFTVGDLSILHPATAVGFYRLAARSGSVGMVESSRNRVVLPAPLGPANTHRIVPVTLHVARRWQPRH